MPTALLLVDVQNTLCRGRWAAVGVEPMVAVLNAVAARTRAAGGTVVVIQHEEDHDAMRRGSEGWQLYDGLAVEPGDPRVFKTACDAFFKTGLARLLQDRGVDHLVIGGMQTEYCVDSTVRGALAQGFDVTLVADGHTTLDSPVLRAADIVAHHNATLANLGNFGPRIRVLAGSEVAADT